MHAAALDPSADDVRTGRVVDDFLEYVGGTIEFVIPEDVRAWGIHIYE
jgi:hypothetical protein